MINAEDIKTWLKKIGKDRKWLAEKTLSSKGTVNNWLSSGINIPDAKLALIARLMRQEEEIPFELPEDFESWLREEADKAKTSIDAIVNRVLTDVVNELNKRKSPMPEESPVVHALEFRGDVWACKLTDLELRGDAAAGSPVPLETPDSTTITVTNDGVVPTDYLLRVNGHSMEPDLPHAALVIARPWQQWPDFPPAGKIVVYHDYRGHAIKRLAYRNGQYALESINKEYPDLEPMEDGAIIGTIIGIAIKSK